MCQWEEPLYDCGHGGAPSRSRCFSQGTTTCQRDTETSFEAPTRVPTPGNCNRCLRSHYRAMPAISETELYAPSYPDLPPAPSTLRPVSRKRSSNEVHMHDDFGFLASAISDSPKRRRISQETFVPQLPSNMTHPGEELSQFPSAGTIRSRPGQARNYRPSPSHGDMSPRNRPSPVSVPGRPILKARLPSPRSPKSPRRIVRHSPTEVTWTFNTPQEADAAEAEARYGILAMEEAHKYDYQSCERAMAMMNLTEAQIRARSDWSNLTSEEQWRLLSTYPALDSRAGVFTARRPSGRLFAKGKKSKFAKFKSFFGFH